MTRVARVFVVSILAISFAETSVSAGEPIDSSELIVQAVDSYQDALDETERARRIVLFGRAETLFDQVIKSHLPPTSGNTVSADLYFNLGNAALGAEHLGQAILAYRKALRVSPNHSGAQQNLQYARERLPGWVPTEEQHFGASSFLETFRKIRAEQWLSFAAIAFLVAMISIAAHLRNGRSIWRSLAAASLFGWMGCFAAGWLFQRDQVINGVVMVGDIVARSADSFNAPAKFNQPVPAGLEFQLIDQREGWIKARLADGRDAWLPDSSIELVE